MKNKIILKGFTAPFLFFSVGLVSANVSNNISSNRFGVHNNTNDFRSYNANRNLLHSSYNFIDLNSNRKVFNTYYRNNTDLNFLFNGLTVRKELDNILKFRSNTDDAYLLSGFRLHNTNHKGLNNIRFFDLRKIVLLLLWKLTILILIIMEFLIFLIREVITIILMIEIE
ncbi:hypothetical protein ONA02_06845 [Mycoplasmopsis felis]|uniref:hypothetical protein n=1 Tax=Mycoplasmopsis felis TaxID=33923 RepID=UPI002286018A|nr:hypothetical protein [Mycoplasmopsis felis]WAM02260.1 hypothetical protein ONA02_06845 [Mycoplasmopsis felis]